jgi:hypothetical protein
MSRVPLADRLIGVFEGPHPAPPSARHVRTQAAALCRNRAHSTKSVGIWTTMTKSVSAAATRAAGVNESDSCRPAEEVSGGPDRT